MNRSDPSHDVDLAAIRSIRGVELNPKSHVRLLDGVHIDATLELQGVTEQFLESADTYHARYFNDAFWTYLVGRAMSGRFGEVPRPPKILDIGTGSGNTVFPLARMFPRASITACDISEPLLRILKEVAKHEAGLSERLSLVCFDLHDDFFAPAQFDFIVGGAILHHMIDPRAALINVAKWLKPGGALVLFEPMEVGAHFVCALFHMLLDDDDLPAPLASVFRAFVEDYDARWGVPRVKPWTPTLDDKWMFSPTYLRQLAADIGLSEVVIRNHSDDDLSDMFRRQVEALVRLSGRWDQPLPARTIEKLIAYDAGISNTLKKQIPPEGIVSMRRR